MKIAQIGLGNWGVKHNKILKTRLCDVVVVEVEENFISAIEQIKPDAVFVTTSSVMHLPITLFCLKNSIPVFCEKPICTKRSQLDLLRPYADRFFMSGHQLVFADEIKQLKNKDIFYMNAMRSGAIPRDEGAVLSLAVHDISILYYLYPNIKLEVMEAQGNKHEAKIYLTSPLISADLYVRSFSDVKLRHTSFLSYTQNIPMYRFTPDNWSRIDLLEREIEYFLDCLDKKTNPVINNLKSSIKIMETAFQIKEKIDDIHR